SYSLSTFSHSLLCLPREIPSVHDTDRWIHHRGRFTTSNRLLNCLSFSHPLLSNLFQYSHWYSLPPRTSKFHGMAYVRIVDQCDLADYCNGITSVWNNLNEACCLKKNKLYNPVLNYKTYHLITF
ncbi:hypothetical protein EG68_08521, partial [Paragonimus skrjabini miyazakii]